MPIPRVKMWITPKLGFSLLQTNLNSQLAILSVKDKPFNWSYDNAANEYILDVRFNSKTDANSFYQYVNSKKGSFSTQGTGKITIHDCMHDDSTVLACNSQAANYQEFIL